MDRFAIRSRSGAVSGTRGRLGLPAGRSGRMPRRPGGCLRCRPVKPSRPMTRVSSRAGGSRPGSSPGSSSPVRARSRMRSRQVPHPSRCMMAWARARPVSTPRASSAVVSARSSQSVSFSPFIVLAARAGYARPRRPPAGVGARTQRHARRHRHRDLGPASRAAARVECSGMTCFAHSYLCTCKRALRDCGQPDLRLPRFGIRSGCLAVPKVAARR